MKSVENHEFLTLKKVIRKTHVTLTTENDDYWENQEGMTTTTNLELNDDETN